MSTSSAVVNAAVFVSLGLGFVMGDTVNTNNVTTRYFIGTFNEGEFPLSIGTCNPLDIFGQNGYQKARCIGEDTLQWSVYGDSDCTSLTARIEYNDSTRTGLGTYLDFNCDKDAQDAYAVIDFAAFACDSLQVRMNAAIGTCAFLYDDEVSIQVYCEENWAEMYYFDTDGGSYADCDASTVYNIANATEECGFMLKTSGIKVFGSINDCIVRDPLTTTTIPETTPEETGSTTENGHDSDDSISKYAFQTISLFISLIVAALQLQ